MMPPVSRRGFLAGAGALVGASRLRPQGIRNASPANKAAPALLDDVYRVHSGLLPEALGTNHYPMVVETLVALERPEVAREVAARYGGEFDGAPLRVEGVDARAWRSALGTLRRGGDWQDFFRARLTEEPWESVLATWSERLAPGIVAAAFHGAIRTGHAARALARRDTAARRDELAAGLAYWADRYLELPAADARRDADAGYRAALRALDHPWPDGEPPVGYFSAPDLTSLAHLEPFVPGVAAEPPADPHASLSELVGASAELFLEMQRRGRLGILLLHAVTGPAAVELMLPHVPERTGRWLVEHAWQGAAAMYASYGVAPRGTQVEPRAWDEVVGRAVASRDAHAIKLTEALLRSDRIHPHPAHSAAAWEWVGP